MSQPASATDRPVETAGRYAYRGLERVIHEKARLGIMTSLMVHSKGLLFSDLKEFCDLTDGNLSRHLQVLHDDGLVEVWKGTKNRRPQTLCRLTDEGRRRFLEYVNVLEHVVSDALSTTKPAELNPTTRSASTLPEGWKPA